MGSLLTPILAVILIFVIFTLLLKRRFKKDLFIELGFIYISFVVIYTIAPGLGLIYSLSRPNEPIGMLLDSLQIDVSNLSRHLWRHFLFIFSFSGGYYFFRGKDKMVHVDLNGSKHFTIIFLIVFISVSLIFLNVMSAPVETYYENYTRYDHLSVPLRKLASLFIRFKIGFYTILLTLLFSQYNRYKKFIYSIILSLCLIELIFSHGSRIYIFIILLQAFFLYNFFVKIISLKKIALSVFLMMIFFSAIEVVRLLDVKTSDAKEVLTENNIGIPGELGALFVPGFQLYTDREKGTLPHRDWQMFFYDFISPFSFNSFTKWNTMYWYAENYFPNAVVPPFTIGPIAESALWGGEIDLFFRGLINGVFFAFIVKWFLKRKSKWWAITIYAYCFSFSIITLKYSVFFYLTPLIKELLPTLIITALLMNVFSIKTFKSL